MTRKIRINAGDEVYSSIPVDGPTTDGVGVVGRVDGDATAFRRVRSGANVSLQAASTD